MSREVLGYHGTSRDVASIVVSGQDWRLSRNQWDWLGDGVYFWEYGPARAWDWACQFHGRNAAVVRARVLLGDCLDLTDLIGTRDLRRVFAPFCDRLRRVGAKLPENRGRHHGLDRAVLNFFAENIEPSTRVVRAPFIEGAALWPDSFLFEKAHVQLAVRDVSLIRDVEWIEDPENERF